MSVSSSKKVKTSARIRNVCQDHHQVQGKVAQDHVVEDERESCAEAFAVRRRIAELLRAAEGVTPSRHANSCTFSHAAFQVALRLPSSIGIRSTRHSRTRPHRKKKMFAIHTPSHGGILP